MRVPTIGAHPIPDLLVPMKGSSFANKFTTFPCTDKGSRLNLFATTTLYNETQEQRMIRSDYHVPIERLVMIELICTTFDG